MGCDFYVFYKICIQYKRDDKLQIKEHEVDGTRERGYWWDCQRDEDFEELIDYHDRCAEQRREQINMELRNYPRMDIFRDGRWMIIASAQENYKNIAKKYNITENEIVTIWKEGDFMVR